MKNLVWALALILLVSPFLVSAHQPRLVSGDVVMIRNPEISQAFYGELKGVHDHYNIIEEEGFELYVSILVPDLPGIGKDVSVAIEPIDEIDNNFIYFLNGTDFQWERYYEEFGGDWYYQGPDIKANVGPGGYDIHVMSTDNLGKYVLVVGEIESFPIDEIINTIFTMPALKQDFFEKPAYTAFFNLIGLFIFGPVILVLIILVLVLLFLTRRGKGKK
ncbi:MAG: hypothetical protein JSV39_02210 [Candidatus Aenigmatarchaeota archaeon]|nr:MAG: hypothetical protein JSV39_02210 [Candidatus Aenigmarchaeota archaeon]